MSAFIVESKVISEIHPHPNADRLEVAKFENLGYNLVIPKGKHQKGETIVYIPLDSILPDELAEEIGVKAYLGGKDKNIVKTAVLRGVASQGIAASLDILKNRGIPSETASDKLADLLKITKFNPEPKNAQNAILYPLPANRSGYDIENSERLQKVVEMLLERETLIIVTEKLEGCQVGVYFDQNGPTFFIRNNSIVEDTEKENAICRIIRENRLPELAQRIFEKIGHPISLHCEALGPGSGLSNYYDLVNSLTPCFDIGVRLPSGWTYLNHQNEEKLEILRVPQIFTGTLREFLGDKTLIQKAHGKSLLNPKKLREGIVIKPLQEENIPLELGGGRLILKSRDPIYLSKN